MVDKQEGRLAEFLSDNSEGILVGVLVVAVAAALVVGGFYLSFFWGTPASDDPAAWGQLGDYLGGVLNPVFGFLSVFALLVALVLQTRELKLSRESLKLSQEELKLSREEQAKSAEALALQNDAIRKQSFEQTFFAMMKLQKEVLDGVSIRVATTKGGVSIQGRGALRQFFTPLIQTLERGDILPGQIRQTLDSEMVKRMQSSSIIGAAEYARTLCVLLDYVARFGIKSDEIYPRLLRSQMDKDEVLFIYFLCFTMGWQRLQGHVEHYGLFADLDPKATGMADHYRSFFKETAFISH